jgi:hypothetical protein
VSPTVAVAPGDERKTLMTQAEATILYSYKGREIYV